MKLGIFNMYYLLQTHDAEAADRILTYNLDSLHTNMNDSLRKFLSSFRGRTTSGAT